MREQTDHVTVITGASRGIGRELALDFAKRGSAIVAVADQRESVDVLAREIAAEGATCRPY